MLGIILDHANCGLQAKAQTTSLPRQSRLNQPLSEGVLVKVGGQQSTACWACCAQMGPYKLKGLEQQAESSKRAVISHSSFAIQV